MDKNKQIISISEAADHLGVSVMTLRRWDKSGKLVAIKSHGGHRYYDRETVERFKEDIFNLALAWARGKKPTEISDNYYSSSQDIFRARLESMALLINREPGMLGLTSLITAVAGEIGNNSFDHNLGNWPDIPGIFFAYDQNRRLIVLADRGVGIRTTLSRSRPEIKDDYVALKVAMTETVSGRAPEMRGNGLKFVRRVALSSSIAIFLQSGYASTSVRKDIKRLRIKRSQEFVRGVIARIRY